MIDAFAFRLAFLAEPDRPAAFNSTVVTFRDELAAAGMPTRMIGGMTFAFGSLLRDRVRRLVEALEAGQCH